MSLSPCDVAVVLVWCGVVCHVVVVSCVVSCVCAVWCVRAEESLVSTQHVPVCAVHNVHAHTCLTHTCACDAGTHEDVLNVHTACMDGGEGVRRQPRVFR